MQALRKEPEWRYQTAAELRDDITRYLEGRPVSDLPDPPRLSLGPKHEPLSNENSLAVLPLKLLDVNQVDSAPDFLGTGLADALITRLSAIRNFAVRPTSSVLRYDGRNPLRRPQTQRLRTGRAT
jgi:TolB-like protein